MRALFGSGGHTVGSAAPAPCLGAGAPTGATPDTAQTTGAQTAPSRGGGACSAGEAGVRGRMLCGAGCGRIQAVAEPAGVGAQAARAPTGEQGAGGGEERHERGGASVQGRGHGRLHAGGRRETLLTRVKRPCETRL